MNEEDNRFENSSGMERAVGRIEGQLIRTQMLLQDLRSDIIRHFEDDKQAFRDFNQRLAGVEKKLWWFSGVGACVAFIVAKLTGKF